MTVSQPSTQRDHPRGCGEHPAKGSPMSAARGSSPRMRGAQTRRTQGHTARGIIPADAGSTGCTSARLLMIWDHPRGCGEHRCCLPGQRWERGLSLRMRGARFAHCICVRISGIIPADAGSTRYWLRVMAALPDHPRGCGEHALATIIYKPGTGSSPRMRGAPICRPSPNGSVRIIPADAGSTWVWCPIGPRRGDHPRGCGEHKQWYEDLPRDEGSSPRMRGARQRPLTTGGFFRIIPADAGSTVSSASADGSCEDHPRGCGEHWD